MKKLYIAGLALVALLAVGVLGASSALASETSPEFLLNKVAITKETAVEATGEIELTDLKAVLGLAATVLCPGVLMGKILFPETNHVIIESVLSSAGGEVTELSGGKALEGCTNVKNCAEPLVYPVDLNWLALLEFMSGHEWKWLLVLEEEGKGQPGWEVECMSVGLSDTCIAKAGAPAGLLIENMTGGDLLAVFLGTELEEEKLLANCTLGGENQGVVNSEAESGLIAPTGGGELEVS